MLERDLADINALRRAALAVLEPKEATLNASGLYVAEERSAAAWERAMAAFDALLAAPCSTLADVQTKVRLLLARPAFGGELEYEEGQTLMRSFLPAGGAS